MATSVAGRAQRLVDIIRERNRYASDLMATTDHEMHTSPIGTTRVQRAVWWRLLGLAVVLIAVWVPRGTDLNRVVTPDEPLWLARSANFYRAVSHGDWADTYQYVHPGVVTMWLGAAGYLKADHSYADDVPGPIDQWHGEIEAVLESRGVSPLDVLIATRSMMVLGFMLLCGVAFWYASRLFEFGTALLGGLFVAFDPFLIAHSRLLHVDAPTTALLSISLLALLSYLTTGRRWRDLIVSGVVIGLAVLSRSTALVLIPFAGLLFVGRNWQEQQVWRATVIWRNIIAPLLMWGVSALIAGVALWPAMWVHPIRTVGDVVTGAVNAAEEGHGKEIFFNGTIYADGNPGWLFYPVTILWRTTPPVLIGLGLAIAAFVVFRGPRWSRDQRFVVVALASFALLFLIMMSVSAKKFDRYVLPVYPPLDFIAAWGWVATIGWLSRRRFVLPHRLSTIGVGVALILTQAGVARSARPYYLDAYNPLFGGTRRAVDVMMVGWGEGLDQIGSYLQTFPNAAKLRVRTGAWPKSLSFFGKSSISEDLYTPDRKGSIRWASTDLYVWYITPTQRGWLAPELEAFFASLPAGKTVSIDELAYARVYDLRTAPLPDFFRTEAAGMTDWEDTIRIVAMRPPYGVVAPGEQANATLFVQDLSLTDRAIGMRLSLLDVTGNEIARRDADLAEYRRSRTIWPVKLTVAVPEGTSAGTYTIAVTLYDLTTGASLTATDSATGLVAAAPFVFDQVVVAVDDPNGIATPTSDVGE